MTTRLTLFTATLVQDSALSVSGLDRESSADQPFAVVDGVPTLVGRGLKGAAVAMAKRFFHPLPRAVSDDIKNGSLRRSAWDFEGATAPAVPAVRAGVGIRHKTGARADGVLYDREVTPAGTKWQVSFRVDWSHIVGESEGHEVEGILGYVLERHWAQGRCWLGGGVARGLGWCHVEDLRAWRFDDVNYEAWVMSRRSQPGSPLRNIPIVEPTRPWCIRTLDVGVSFGEYRPDSGEAAWGVDMLAVGPHDAERAVQPTGDGAWAKPTWGLDAETPVALGTDRAILMDGSRPLLPGSSVRGPLRHGFSRAMRRAHHDVQDPHLVRGSVRPDDLGGSAFGTVSQSSRILVRDARANVGWSAAKLHMHAEDEFSASSYMNAKRDAVRLLAGEFPVRIVIEGPTPEDVEPLVALIDHQVAHGVLGHLPMGGHKTRGAGGGRWMPKPWVISDVIATRGRRPATESGSPSPPASQSTGAFIPRPADSDAWVRTSADALGTAALKLGEAADFAKVALGARALVAWWCDPTINLDLSTPPTTFGRDWPDDRDLQVDEVAFYGERAVWRAVRTPSRARFVLIEEVVPNEDGAKRTTVVHTPARLHAYERFSSANTGRGNVLLREWRVGDEILGFTLTKEQY